MHVPRCLLTFKEPCKTYTIESAGTKTNFALDVFPLADILQTQNWFFGTKDDVIQKYIKMTKDATLERSSQQENKDLINRRNEQSPKHLKFLLLVFSWGPSQLISLYNIFRVDSK